MECTGKTGVEMEALMAASIALLTVYDMCKDEKELYKELDEVPVAI